MASKAGSAKCGSFAGISPITLTPRSSSPSHATNAAIAATTISKSGSSRQPIRSFNQRSPTTSAIVPSPIAAVAAWMPPPSYQRQPEAVEKVGVRVAHGVQAEQVLQLVEHQQAAGARREADDDGVGDVARQVAEPAQRDGELDRPDHEGEQDGGLDLLVLSLRPWRSR